MNQSVCRCIKDHRYYLDAIVQDLSLIGLQQSHYDYVMRECNWYNDRHNRQYPMPDLILRRLDYMYDLVELKANTTSHRLDAIRQLRAGVDFIAEKLGQPHARIYSARIAYYNTKHDTITWEVVFGEQNEYAKRSDVGRCCTRV